MSEKSSLPQPTRSVSRALTRTGLRWNVCPITLGTARRLDCDAERRHSADVAPLRRFGAFGLPAVSMSSVLALSQGQAQHAQELHRQLENHREDSRQTADPQSHSSGRATLVRRIAKARR
jgi:hypothetical protein